MNVVSFTIANKYRKLTQKIRTLEDTVLTLSKNPESSPEQLLEAARILQNITSKMAVITARASKHIQR